MKNRLRIEQTNFGLQLIESTNAIMNIEEMISQIHSKISFLQETQDLTNIEEILNQIDTKVNALQDLYNVINIEQLLSQIDTKVSSITDIEDILSQIDIKVDHITSFDDILLEIKTKINSITNIEDTMSQIDTKISFLQDLYSAINNVLEQEKMKTRLVVIEGTIKDFINEDRFYIPIPYKSIEIKTVEFTNKVNTDKIQVSISEKDDFSDFIYMSLGSEKIYDILSLPVIDTNDDSFKLKVHIKNMTSLNNRLTIDYRIKLNGLILKEEG